MKYYVFSPGGNSTLFLEAQNPDSPESSLLCRQGLKLFNVEQAAAANLQKPSLAMAGGEFCANACRAFAALLAWKGESKAEKKWILSIAGIKVELEASGSYPLWQAKATFNIAPLEVRRLADNLELVVLPGIAHILARVEEFPVDLQERSLDLIRQFDMERHEACGVIWTRAAGDGLEIRPFVAVPAAGTAMLESSCGSGSLALAVACGAKRLSVLQPSGETLEIAASESMGRMSAAGSVRLLAHGGVSFARLADKP